MACNFFLGDVLDQIFENAPAQVAKKRMAWLSTLLALAWSLVKRLFTSSGSGREAGVQMDARLRRACRRLHKHGVRRLDTSSTKEEEVAVIAKITDLDRFRQHVNSITTIIKRPNDDQTMLVTARLRGDEDRIEYLRKQPFVKSLKASARIRPFMEQTRREIFACPDSLPLGHKANGGSDVIIGIIDFGLDFAHRNFRHSNGHTRILALWDQKASPDANHSPQPYGYGRLFTEDEINESLKEADPYKALGYGVSKSGLLDAGGHGTYVADVAAGNGLGSGCSGVAPKAEIVFVDVSTVGTPIHEPHKAGGTFGNSVQLLEAIHFIFELAKAKNLPCAINISLGTNGGSHDGTSPLEEAMDWLVTQEPNRSVVIAAGNSFGKALHATGRVPEGGCIDLKWKIPRFDTTGNELEIWYASEDRFTIDLIDPDGKRVARVKPRCIWEKTDASRGLMTVVNRLDDPNNRDNTINVFFERGVRDGVWTLRLRGDHVRDGNFHAWIERDESGQSRFVKPKDKAYLVSNEYTLSSIACGHETIVVGSYNAYEADLPLSEFSSAGPTRDIRDQQQPTLCAPGEDMLVAQSTTEVLRRRQSGTSLSAAVVTGTVALILAEAREQGITLTADQIRKILIGTAHRDTTNGNQWDSGAGYGRVCAKAAVADVGCGLKREVSAASSGEWAYKL
jgi:subtilisin family serine protease